MAKAETAVVVGVGPGLGAALVRRFAQAGMNVAAVARDSAKIKTLFPPADKVQLYNCDAADEQAVENLFAQTGAPSLVVYNAGAYVRKGILETSVEEFERCWKIGCLGGFLVARAAARAMLARGGGTIIFTGATASLRGGALFHNLAVGKFGLRALAQSMAREFQPQGIHVAHVVIDGQIKSARPGYGEAERGQDAVLDPAAIAETYYQLHMQPRNAWSLELDLRPWAEKF
ncbi:MAG: SDR family NAD(P)-dependent oxidoreductase [Burkholderiales bacterium]